MQIELKHIHRQLGVTTVYVTHDQREALTMSDRIAVINHGELAQVDTPEAIYNKPSNEFVADFIGESTMLPLTQDSAGRLTFGESVVASEAPDPSHNDWSLVIRPERLRVLAKDASAGDQHVMFSGTVTEAVFQGDTAFALVKLRGGATLTVRFGTGAVSEGSRLEAGQSVSVGLIREDLILIPRESA
ncbi:MAG: TOBE domain-containing protein [Gammaproteobacteria bacterium]|nr:TOBE domain-containing protein [Gammaproteobacteria bacterium]